MTTTQQTLLSELGSIDRALLDGSATAEQDQRGQELVQLANAAPHLLSALIEVVAEIRYRHPEVEDPGERLHPRGSGWARVYDHVLDAIAEARNTR